MYKYIQVGQEIQNIAIPTPGQIDEVTIRSIRRKYDISDEFKMNRLAKTSTEWKAYNEYVSACVEEGQKMKVQAATDLAIWQDNQWDESVETRSEFIDRMKEKGLI